MKEDPLQTCPEIVHNIPASASASAPNLDQKIKPPPSSGPRTLLISGSQVAALLALFISSWSTFEPYSCSCSCSTKVVPAPQSSYSSWPWCSSRLIDLDYPHQSRSIRPVTSTNHESGLRPRTTPTPIPAQCPSQTWIDRTTYEYRT